LPPLGSRFTLSSGSRSVTFISSSPLTGKVSTIAAEAAGCSKAISLGGAAVKILGAIAAVGAGATTGAAAGAAAGFAADHADASGCAAGNDAGVGSCADVSFTAGAIGEGKLAAGTAAMAGVGGGISIEFLAASNTGADDGFGAGIDIATCDGVGSDCGEITVFDLVIATGSTDETGSGDGAG